MRNSTRTCLSTSHLRSGERHRERERHTERDYEKLHKNMSVHLSPAFRYETHRERETMRNSTRTCLSTSHLRSGMRHTETSFSVHSV
ncbi:UNVERIFIED_CONTAM: hypothetical protein FKN15_068559 [Acipenser sinensis]